MLSKKVLSLAMTATLALGFMSGCASNANSDSEGSSDNKVIKIVTQSPLSGGSATLGEAIKLGAQLAIDQQKDKFAELGFEIKLDAQDDQGDPKKGVANANLVVADQSVLGVVGHLNSGVSIPASEVYEKNNLVSVSPASTATDYTDRGLKTVSRVVARDDFQGPAGAQYAVETLGAKKIFVVQDKTAYGSGLADAFRAAAEELGAEIVGYEGITVGEKDFNGVLNQVASKKPDLIYFGGLYAEGGILVKQAREKGLDIPFMGGDGLDSSTFVEIAGDAVKNTFLTSVAGDTTKSEEGTKFAEDYQAAFGKSIESYSAYAYDSAAVLLAGIEKAIKDNDNKLPSREDVTNAVRETQDYKGVVTEVGFDEKGDNKYAKIFIYKFDEAKYPANLEDEISQ
ncbi:branched-chain amino acid ABC transporter substrate-binding protein [Niallia sp. Sow4_A1]|jgi:branched-chain amino acid transport system substrate-binding protein|uniref:Branched-chain amino acid ABC transporter substrate-binding protein n=1 Tax=Niallia hominis TaxID=3133173 RepID=A0ABV1F533_9BACI|nr:MULTISPECIES: branched-chain amino acid ABC transporter substrate-binding protein [Bacillaceae]MCM3364265.1 branched-chain amino acid ABC transporter substrate-binding protein [Niallia sp. MER TA 168]CAI9393136.1 Leu/Ile/Val-binding protein [Bacillus sp. T2.9-1]